MLDKKVTADQCQGKRKNHPRVGLVTMEMDHIRDKQIWQYDPHFDPTLPLGRSRVADRKLIDNELAGTCLAEVLRME